MNSGEILAVTGAALWAMNGASVMMQGYPQITVRA